MDVSIMKIKVSKWGACLAVRIPVDVARRMQLHEGDEVNAELQENAFVIEKAEVTTLDALLAGVTDGNRHGEVNWGPDVGKERL